MEKLIYHVLRAQLGGQFWLNAFMPTDRFEFKIQNNFFNVGPHVLLRFIIDHISYFHILSNEWALYHNRAVVVAQIFKYSVVIPHYFLIHTLKISNI